MIDRRHFAVLVALVVVIVAAAGLLAWRVWSAPEPASPAEPVAVNATIAPQQHLFGDPVRAQVELVVDAKRVDPKAVDVRVNFAPYRPLQPVVRREDSAGRITRVRFEYTLACLAYRCLPVQRPQRRFDLHDATVAYRIRGTREVQTEEIDWPPLQAAGRILPSRLWEAELRGEYRELGPVAYRASPTLVALVALALAVVAGAAALILILRQLPLARFAERLGLKPVDRRTALERALQRVQETATAERSEEGRRALERLAHELRLIQDPELARAASRLAWSRDFPADGRLTRLSADVERLISERV
ncbi:MAG TPA: hypothetical protein VGU26_10655 [Gaiellaceae bacterium]|nr:hypothetical protein [Gaiellaceae bacterium]